jgi:hypothetical protein
MPERDVFVDRYDGEIRFVDHHFGRLMETLRELEQARAALSPPKELAVPRDVDPSLLDRLRSLGYIE